MSTSAPTPQGGQAAPPTQEDILAIARAAATAADEAKSQAANIEAMVKAGQAEATSRGVDIPEPVIKSIATQAAEATMGMLREAGALRPDGEGPPTPPPPDGTGTPAGTAGVAGTPPPAGADPPKARKSWAERICDVVIKSDG